MDNKLCTDVGLLQLLYDNQSCWTPISK